MSVMRPSLTSSASMSAKRERLKETRFFRWSKAPIRRALSYTGYDLVPERVEEELWWSRLFTRFSIERVVDVGANQGQYAAQLRRRGFDGHIVSFEPMEQAFGVLLNASRRDRRWECRQRAIADTPGESSFYVSANSVSSSLLPVEDVHVRAAPSSRTSRIETVPVSTLDDEFDGASVPIRTLLKLDVQGAEMPALRGGASFIGRDCSLIQTELSTRPLYEGQGSCVEIMESLESAGFGLISVIPGFHDPETGDLLQFDGVFARV